MHRLNRWTIVAALLGVCVGQACIAQGLTPSKVLKADGAFGFPQTAATVLCDTETLRLSSWNDGTHLYVQAVVWGDHEDVLGSTSDGRKIGDNSVLVVDADADGKATPQVDRSYCLNAWPRLAGLHYSVTMGETSSTGLQGDSKGRGSIQLVERGGSGDGKSEKIRVDNFLIPLDEIGRKAGERVRIAYWGTSPATEPRLTVNSIGFKTEKALYYPHHLPREQFHELTLSDRAAAFDAQQVLEGRTTIEVKAKAPMPKIGEEPPEVAAKRWFNFGGAGEPSLKSLRGKVIVVEFWATWCGPCVAGIPHLNELHEKHAKDGLVILSLTDQEPTPIEKFVKDKGMKYIVGAESEAVSAYGVSGIPHAFVIGRDGKLAWEGYPALKEFDEAIVNALGSK